MMLRRRRRRRLQNQRAASHSIASVAAWSLVISTILLCSYGSIVPGCLGFVLPTTSTAITNPPPPSSSTSSSSNAPNIVIRPHQRRRVISVQVGKYDSFLEHDNDENDNNNNNNGRDYTANDEVQAFFDRQDALQKSLQNGHDINDDNDDDDIDPYHHINRRYDQRRKKDNGSSTSSSHKSRSHWKEFSSALCIIPPHWDRLQRARHYARDSLFHTWPPAIRLFHPFGGSIASGNSDSSSTTSSSTQITALDVAQAVEELQLERFTITLDTWVIVPHLEAMQAEWERAASNPTIEDHLHIGKDTQESVEDREVRELIEHEEQLGKEAYVKRIKKQKLRKKQQKRKNKLRLQQQQAAAAAANNGNGTVTENVLEDFDDEDDDDDDDDDFDKEDTLLREDSFKKPKNANLGDDSNLSPAESFREQQRRYEESGGPCVLCLEPDLESKLMLQQFRQALAEYFGVPEYFSPSSAYSWTKLRYDELSGMGYRPLIPISSFDSLEAAMDVARRLKGVWGDPLTFDVDELHHVSCRDHEENVVSDPMERIEWRKIPWGCNAIVKLLSEEDDDDDYDDEENDAADADIEAMLRKLVEEGTAGGMDISQDITILEDEEEPLTDLELWLNDDEDFDEGSTLVMGRTTFFTGDQRAYQEMPVSSVVDHKDRSMGERGMVSGSARRRRTSTRKKNSFEHGEYGRRDVDYLPWNKHERKRRMAFMESDGSIGSNRRKNDKNVVKRLLDENEVLQDDMSAEADLLEEDDGDDEELVFETDDDDEEQIIF